MSKLVRGIGINNNKYPSYADRKDLKEYNLWESMLERCTEKFWKRCPTYSGTTCSENFKSYNYFYEWCQEQVGFGNKDENNRFWQLDKDLLVKGNKLYSEDTCVFVPSRINSLLIKCDATRGEFPVGVRWHKRDKRFLTQCSDGKGKLKHLGTFTTPREAFQAYKVFKEALIKEVANEYKELLDVRVYEALMNYEVHKND